jgi:hypothetical protein
MTTLEEQIAGDIARLSTSGFGGMVPITVTDGATVTNLKGWWKEDDPTEDQDDRGRRRTRRATAWPRLVDLAAVGVDTTFVLDSEPTAIFKRDVFRRDPIAGLWVINLVEYIPLSVKVGRA